MSAAVIGLGAAVNLDDDFIRMGKAQNRTGALFQIIHIPALGFINGIY